jgi:hypothetical protein
MQPETVISELAAALQPLGMILRGGFHLTADDRRELADFPDLRSSAADQTLLLIGNAGPDLYRAFFADCGLAPEGLHPLDGWTRGVIAPLAARFDARAGFPSDGPPWLPFQRWAARAEGLKASPLGVLMHPEYGPWHAYRAVLLLDGALPLPTSPAPVHACDSCAEKPCLTTCPVTAITEAGYAVDPCVAHVRGKAGRPCRNQGCLARRACPVGQAYRYPEAALAFHMAAFLAARPAVERSEPGRA